MTNKEKFLQFAQPYFDAELIREIASTDNLMICNLCDRFYVAYIYELMNNSTKFTHGVIINKDFIKEILEDDNNIILGFPRLSKSEQQKLLIELSPEKYQVMLQLKEKTNREGPSKFIDYQLEQELMAKNKSR